MRLRLIFICFGLVVFSTFLASGFEVSNLLLKVSVHQGDFVNVPFTISSEEGGVFNLAVNGIDGVILDESNFVLESGQEKQIGVSFDSRILAPDVYSGSIEIISDLENSYLPIIFEVESLDVLFDADIGIPLKYSEVNPGDEFVVDVEIFDLTEFELDGSLGRSDIELEFVVLGVDGSIIFSETESLVIEGKTSVTKTLDLPENIVDGNYFITVAVKYGSSVGTSSSSFAVKGFEADSNEEVDFMLVVIVVLILVIIAILIYMYSLKRRLFLGSGGRKAKGDVRELKGKDVKKLFRGKV